MSWVLGLGDRLLRPLIALLESDWHEQHENAAEALGHLGRSEAVPALVGAAEWVPEDLDLDENRTLARRRSTPWARSPAQKRRLACATCFAIRRTGPLRERARRVFDGRSA